MGLTVNHMDAGTCKQPLNFVPLAQNVCLVPAPPPPAGPQGIPAPFPITTDTSKIQSGPVPKVKHLGGEVPNIKSTFPGIKGNEAGVGNLPPGTPKKDIVDGENTKYASATTGSPNCNVGGSAFVFTGSPGF